MEQLVLGFFQEQLSKVIVDFRKEQVTANLLNGKGEITDISLNCSVINEQLSRVSPFMEFDEIHVSRLGFHVTSWTNIRKAPIVVDIGIITAKVQEPLQCLPRHQRKRLQMLSKSELHEMISSGFKPLRGNGSYGLVDRIVDNMTIEMESFRLDVQTWGKFKTKRSGPWTPPLLQIEYNSLKVVMVDADGNEASPDQVWAHNRNNRQHFMIYKKVSGECIVRLRPTDSSSSSNNNNKSEKSPESPLQLATMEMEVQMAVQRRLKDGAVLAVQMDTTIPHVNVELNSQGVHELAHLAAGMRYCFAKDRSFDDPLKPKAESDSHTDGETKFSPTHAPTVKMFSLGASIVSNLGDGDGDDVGQDEVHGGDDRANSKDESLDLSRLTGDGSVTDDAASIVSGSIMETASLASSDDEMSREGSSHGLLGSSRPRRIERPVILLPNGLVIYNSVTLTCSIHNVSCRASYPESVDSWIEFNARGCITEAIWPKTDSEHGLYTQMSTSFVSLQERHNLRKRTLLLGGMQRDDHFSLRLPSRAPKEIGADEFFPLFERRWIRDDPIDLRHLFPTQSFGVKTTISLKRLENEMDRDDTYMVLHEIGVNEMDIVLDTDALERMVAFVFGKNDKPLDPRWHTGDWTDEIAQNMLQHPSQTLFLDNHLQLPKLIFLDDNFMPSSDLFNVTARLTNVELKVPAAVDDNLRSCDLSMKWKETTIVVSSLLPRTFLSGRIGSSISGDTQSSDQRGKVDFPNDPSDICYSLEETKGPGGSDRKSVSTLRFQFTTRNFEMLLTPIIPFCKAMEPRQLVSLSNSTIIFSFEGEPPQEGSNDIAISVFLSALVHQLVLNIDFELLAGALATILYHSDNVASVAETAGELYALSPSSSVALPTEELPDESDSGRLKQTINGRKILVQRHLSQSRETGRLSIVFCMQHHEFFLRVWRQNVPQRSPLRNRLGLYQDISDHGSISVDLLKIANFEMTDFEFGVEFGFHRNGDSRTVVKSFLKKAHLQLCDLESALAEDKGKDRRMLDVFFFGRDSLPGQIDLSGKAQQSALRLEGQHKKDSQSWSIAADVSSPSLVSLYAAAMKNAAILVIEALVLPSFSHRLPPNDTDCPFPPATIGSLFFFPFMSQFSGGRHLDLASLNISDDPSEPIVERYLRGICQMMLPSNLDVILLHCEFANFLVSIPDDGNSEDETTRELSLLLHQAEIVSRFYPIRGSLACEIEHVLACKGTDWSTLINTTIEGFYQRFAARQSLLVFSTDEVEKVIEPFEVKIVYAGGEVHLAMSEDFLIEDIRLIEHFQSRLRSAIGSSADSLSDIFLVVSALKDRGVHGSQIEPFASHVDQNGAAYDSSTDVFRITSNIQKARKLVEKTNEEIRKYETEVQKGDLRRDNAFEATKIALFVKERERVGALSLLSSRVAGWVRVGGRHRTGQRIAKKTLVWPQYAVLRKDLLILYSSPSSMRPVDMISLRNSRIRLLAGGRSKQDIKRAFAIVEHSGMTRFFVAQSAQEFNLWTGEIVSAIRFYSDDDFKDCLFVEQSSGGGTAAASSLDEDNDNDNDEADPRRKSVGNRLASAYQSVRLKGKEMSERRRTKSSDFDDDLEPSVGFDGGSLILQPQTLSGESVEDRDTDSRRLQIGKKISGVGMATKSRLGSALQTARQKGSEISIGRNRTEGTLEGSDRSDGLDDAIPNDHVTVHSRETGMLSPSSESSTRARLQLGSKLGSAIQTARTKAAAAPEKGGRFSGLRGKLSGLAQRSDEASRDSVPRRSPPSSFHGTQTDVEVDSSWTCKSCTFVNSSRKQRRCEMCDTPLKIESTSSDASVSSVKPQVPALAQASVDMEEETVGYAKFENSASLLDPTTTLNVPPEEANEGRNSGRFSFKRRQEAPVDDSLFGGDTMPLRNVRVGGQAPVVASEPTLNSRSMVPLKKLEGHWTVTVRSIQARTATRDTVEPSSSGEVEASPPPADKVDSFEKSVDDGTFEKLKSEEPLEGTNETNEPSKSRQLDLSVTSYGESIEPSRGTVRKGEAIHSQWVFLVQVFETKSLHASNTPASEKQWSLGDVLFFYSQVSEAMESVLTQIVRTQTYEQDGGSLGEIESKLSHSVMAEKVLVSGRVLGGLLVDREESSADLDARSQYQSEAIEFFLNAILECPLPIDALATVSEVLGICASTKDVEQRTDPSPTLLATLNNSAEPNAATSRTNHISSILSLLSSCESEIQLAEMNLALLRRNKHLQRTPDDKGIPSPNAVRPILFEPLLPPSLISSIHASMHEALMNAMAERDEAHAQLIGSTVLHQHTIEKERKKNERLEYDTQLRREIARIQLEQDLQHPNLANLFGGKQDDKMATMRKEIDQKIESFRRMISNNGDEEMVQLCSQLAAEISAKTSHGLEIERLKAVREAEKKSEAAERKALEEELKRVKELLAAEQEKNNRS